VSNFYFIASKQTGEVIDVKGASPTPGASLIAYTRKATGTDNQLWALVPSSTPGYFFIKSKQTGEVIDVQGANPAQGTPLIAYPQKTSGTDNQLWAIVPSGVDGYYFIKSKMQTGDVIDVQGANPQPGTPLIAYPQKTSGTDNQLWQFVAVMA
jgi:hypothetical protein